MFLVECLRIMTNFNPTSKIQYLLSLNEWQEKNPLFQSKYIESVIYTQFHDDSLFQQSKLKSNSQTHSHLPRKIQGFCVKWITCLLLDDNFYRSAL